MPTLYYFIVLGKFLETIEFLRNSDFRSFVNLIIITPYFRDIDPQSRPHPEKSKASHVFVTNFFQFIDATEILQQTPL